MEHMEETMHQIVGRVALNRIEYFVIKADDRSCLQGTYESGTLLILPLNVTQ